MVLTEKERTLLNDLKSEEKLCIDKYNKYSSEASCGELKNLFSSLEGVEQNHYDTITQILNGNTPSMGMGGSQKPNLQQMSGQNPISQQMSAQSQSSQQMSGQSQSGGQDKTKDKYLCSDALGTEKHVSSMYDTCIFEFKDENVRNALNHIQKEEQEHGKKIYDYMSQNGMYS
ncbi:spore coat protein [Aminipila luticellarii]|uniref:Spore coat protein n=1 Tax=Aminipila luticellarii TaxID=2507160 RepID=A0A410PTX8_9FIRM|nr:spore coat protein [Aminipila luticellarii]QAT42385.1 spore coat protein [Aminipila luticellarii]